MSTNAHQDDGVYRIPMLPVSSSNLASVGYDDEKRILSVEFQNGGIFHYAGISADLALDLVNAESIGRFYHQHIRGKFEGAKMTGPCPNCGYTGYIGATCSDCGTEKHIDERGSTDGGVDSGSGAAGSDRQVEEAPRRGGGGV